MEIKYYFNDRSTLQNCEVQNRNSKTKNALTYKISVSRKSKNRYNTKS